MVRVPSSETFKEEKSISYFPRKALNVSERVAFFNEIMGRETRNIKWSLLHCLNVNGLNIQFCLFASLFVFNIASGQKMHDHLSELMEAG